MATSWYLRQAGKVVGPYSSSQLKQMADAALITPQAEVSQAESGPWSAARKVKGLFPDAVPSASAYDDKPPPPTTSHLEQGERRGRIKEYFNAMGSGCAVVLLLIAACLGYLSLYAYGNAARLEMGLAVFCVLGAGGIFMAMKRVPSDSDMDSWLDDDLRNVTALSLGKVGLRRDSIIQDPAVVTGPTLTNRWISLLCAGPQRPRLASPFPRLGWLATAVIARGGESGVDTAFSIATRSPLPSRAFANDGRHGAADACPLRPRKRTSRKPAAGRVPSARSAP